MIELAALDMAGTTIDEGGAVYVALHDAVAAEGVDVPEAAVRRWMGTDKREAMVGLVLDGGRSRPSGEDVERMYERFRAQLAAAYAARPPQPMAGVVDAIAALRSGGTKVALTTGFSRDVVDPLLASLGWTDGVVDAVVCSDDVTLGRPAPYLVFCAMERTGVVDVRRVLVAGDTVADLLSGTDAGAGAVVGVGTGALTLAELEAEPHTHLLASVAELPALVGSL